MHEPRNNLRSISLLSFVRSLPSCLRRPAPLGRRIADRFFPWQNMSRVILLIVCALTVASCLVMQTGAMRSAGESAPRSHCSLFPEFAREFARAVCHRQRVIYMRVRARAADITCPSRQTSTHTTQHTRLALVCGSRGEGAHALCGAEHDGGGEPGGPLDP